MRQKRSRGRAPTCGGDGELDKVGVSEACARWGRCEWFMPMLDAPFFGYSEFDEVLRSMNLRPPRGVATRAEWGRLRAAMCNAFEVYAAPRRLSAAYLAMERRDLALYRADARAAMRGRHLPAANDPVSGKPLGPEWYSRYRYPPPVPPVPGTAVLVRDSDGRMLQASFVQLADDDRVRVRLQGNDQTHLVYDIDVMLKPQDCDDVLPAPTLTPLVARTPATPVTLVRRDPLVALSPRTGSATGAGDVEAEVDVVRLASLIRLVERRTEAVEALRKANNKLQEEMNTIGSGSNASRSAVINAAANVSSLAERTEHILPSNGASTQATPGVGVNVGGFNLTPRPRTAASAIASTTGRPSGIVQKLEDVFGDAEPNELDTHGTVSVPGVPLVEMPVFTPPASTRTPLPAPSIGLVAPLPRTQTQARVDVESAVGALELSKALVQRAMRDENKWAELRAVDVDARARVVECTSACVALLLRARTTRDHGAVQELIEHIRSNLRTAAQPLANAAQAFQRPP